MIWLHIISDFIWVNFSSILELDEKFLKKLISDLIKNNNLTELWNYYHTFSEKNEITCIVALAESHIAMHIWPEKNYISLDIFVCNFWQNNSQKAKKIYNELKKIFKPQKIEEKFIERKSS